MRYIAAYLLLANAGKEANAANIKAVLSSVGIDADEEALNKVGRKTENEALCDRRLQRIVGCL